MTRKEFSTQYARLCKGFKFEATPEQAEAWFARIGHTHIQDWSEAVTTLLCGKYYPKLDEALDEIESRSEHRRRTAVKQDAYSAQEALGRITGPARIEPVDPSRIPTPGTPLFVCIKAFAGREQIRKYQEQVTQNPDMDPKQKKELLREYGQREAKLNAEILLLIPQLHPDDVKRLLNRYEERGAA